jgi:hypothetical protein
MKYSLRNLMKFSIRDLFWLTVVVALAVAWWVEHWKYKDLENALWEEWPSGVVIQRHEP